MKSHLRMLKQIFTSQSGYIFLASQWILFAYAIYQRGDLTPYHPFHETLLLNILVSLNLLPIMVANLLTQILSLAISGQAPADSILIFVSIIFATIQWILVGYCFERLFSKKFYK